jgi:hypothetical protein
MNLDQETATRIQVRWPGGKLTTNNVSAGAREIRVNSDGNLEKTR